MIINWGLLGGGMVAYMEIYANVEKEITWMILWFFQGMEKLFSSFSRTELPFKGDSNIASWNIQWCLPLGLIMTCVKSVSFRLYLPIPFIHLIIKLTNDHDTLLRRSSAKLPSSWKKLWRQCCFPQIEWELIGKKKYRGISCHK